MIHRLQSILRKLLWPAQLRSQVVLLGGIMLLLTTGTLTGYLTAQRIDYELQTMKIDSLAHAKNLAISASTLLITGKYSQIEEMFVLHSTAPGILNILVANEQGKPLITVTNSVSRVSQIRYGGKTVTFPTTVRAVAEVGQDKMTVWQPIEGGSLIGWLKIDYSLQHLRTSQAQTLQHGLIIGVLAIAVGTMLFWLMLAPTVRAIRHAAEFARQLNQRQGETFEPDRSAQELEQLGEALHEASLQLHQQERDLSTAIAKLRDNEEKFRAVSDTANEAIVTADHEGHIVYLNKSAEITFGYTSQEAIGQSLTMLMPKKFHAAHETGFKRYLQTGEARVMGRPVELAGVRKDGSEFPLELSLATWQTAGGQFFSGVMRDITERKQTEARILELTLTDELTGLYNRRGFFQLADAKMPLARRMQLGLQLFYIDLDGMKTINDKLGHAEGDNALRDTAGLLRKTFRNPDLIARLGGDEFIILAFHSAGQPQELIIARLQTHIEQFNKTANRPYALAMSIGTATFDPDSQQTLEAAVAESDAAMYRTKQQRHANS